jgi:hypothetical protein
MAQPYVIIAGFLDASDARGERACRSGKLHIVRSYTYVCYCFPSSSLPTSDSLFLYNLRSDSLPRL